MLYYIVHNLLERRIMDNRMQREKTRLGALETQVLAYAQLRKQDIICTGDLSPVLGISPKQEWELLSRMARSGLLIRLKRGVYLVPSRIPPGGRWAASEYYILSRLMSVYDGKYQISGPNAFNFYGYDDQVPNRVYVYNNRLFGDKNIGGVEYVFIKTSDKRLGSVERFRTAEGFEILMASRARALMDAVYDWSRYNTIPRAYGWIVSSVTEKPELAKDLIVVTSKFGNKATIRRVGYLLTQCGFKDEQLAQLRKKMGSAKSVIPWIPGAGRKGAIAKDWGLIINGRVPQ